MDNISDISSQPTAKALIYVIDVHLFMHKKDNFY